MTNLPLPVDVFATIAGYIDNPSTYHSFALSCKHAASAVRRGHVRERAIQRFTRPRRGWVKLRFQNSAFANYALWDELPNGHHHGVMLIFQDDGFFEMAGTIVVSILWAFNQMVVQLRYTPDPPLGSILGVDNLWRACLYENNRRVLVSTYERPEPLMPVKVSYDIMAFADGRVKRIYYNAKNEFDPDAMWSTNDEGESSADAARILLYDPSEIHIIEKGPVPPERGYFYRIKMDSS